MLKDFVPISSKNSWESCMVDRPEVRLETLRSLRANSSDWILLHAENQLQQTKDARLFSRKIVG